MERMRVESNLIEGRLPVNGNEIVIPNHIRTNAGIDYKIGDVIEADIGERIINTGFETIVTKARLIATGCLTIAAPTLTQTCRRSFHQNNTKVLRS